LLLLLLTLLLLLLLLHWRAKAVAGRLLLLLQGRGIAEGRLRQQHSLLLRLLLLRLLLLLVDVSLLHDLAQLRIGACAAVRIDELLLLLLSRHRTGEHIGRLVGR